MSLMCWVLSRQTQDMLGGLVPSATTHGMKYAVHVTCHITVCFPIHEDRLPAMSRLTTHDPRGSQLSATMQRHPKHTMLTSFFTQPSAQAGSGQVIQWAQSMGDNVKLCHSHGSEP